MYFINWNGGESLWNDYVRKGEIIMLERKPQSWDYKMHPNKLLELVKNIGNMEQEGTGLYVDSESEMLTILAYLNYDEKTNITESMREQIDQAVKNLESKHLEERDFTFNIR